MPETISEEYGSGQYFLRGLSREMQHMAAGPGSCAALVSCAAAGAPSGPGRCFSENFDEEERKARISVSKWL